MKKFEKYKHQRFKIEAKRKGTENWSEWTFVDDYNEAVRQRDKAEKAGFDARIIDRGISTDGS